MRAMQQLDLAAGRAGPRLCLGQLVEDPPKQFCQVLPGPHRISSLEALGLRSLHHRRRIALDRLESGLHEKLRISPVPAEKRARDVVGAVVV